MTIHAELPPGIIASADAVALEQAVLNLLDNATKYGPNGQEIGIALTADGQGNSCIRVSDQGPGVPEAARDEIWEPYSRLDRDRVTAVAGTGIGLAVVHEVVQRLGGRCWVEDAPIRGACFVIELPIIDGDSSEAGG